MNYQKIHDNIINNARIKNQIKIDQTIYEKHHIIPKCIGGTNDESNLVILTIKEHFIIHKILTKIYPDNYHILWAFSCMLRNGKKKRKLSSRHFEEAKIAASNAYKKSAYKNGYHFNDNRNKLLPGDKEKIYYLFVNSLKTKEEIGKEFNINGCNVIHVLEELGMNAKERRTIACKKREERHKQELLQKGIRRKSYKKGKPRNINSIEKQRESIKNYWKKVRKGIINRIQKSHNWKSIICIETNKIFRSINHASKFFKVNDINRELIDRKNNQVFHYRLLENNEKPDHFNYN